MRRPNNRAEPNVEPLVVAPPNRQGHGEARHRRENPGPMHQRWARDIENSQGRGNSRSDARIIVANTQVRPVVVDWELANAYWEASSTTSAIDDSREPQTYTVRRDRGNRRSGRNDTTQGLRGILKRSGSSHRPPTVNDEGNER